MKLSQIIVEKYQPFRNILAEAYKQGDIDEDVVMLLDNKIHRAIVIETAERLGFFGKVALRTSGEEGEDEFDMINDYLDKQWDLETAIREVVRTRKHRE